MLEAVHTGVSACARKSTRVCVQVVVCDILEAVFRQRECLGLDVERGPHLCVMCVCVCGAARRGEARGLADCNAAPVRVRIVEERVHVVWEARACTCVSVHGYRLAIESQRPPMPAPAHV